MKVKLHNPFQKLTKFEWILMCSSFVVVLVCSFLGGRTNPVSLVASLLGVAMLIFVAKGDVWGQVGTVVFSILYAVASYSNAYYGEMITYLGMTLPIAVFSVVSWLRHPYRETTEVRVNRIKGKEWALIFAAAVAVTTAFYFILRAFSTAQLALSTFSVATSFLASYLMFRRSPFYAVAYAANDCILIGLWVFAAIGNIEYLSMAVCFTVFLVNDIYGFVSWQRRSKKQREEENFS